MAEIKFEIDKANDLTTVTIIGDLQPGELAAILEDYYQKSPTRLIMMDSRQGSWCSMSTDEYNRSIQSWITRGKSRKGGRTAIIFSDPADFGMGRYLESHLSMAGFQAEMECFRDFDKGKRWLFENS